MLPQEFHRTLRLGDAQVDNALFEDLLDVVLLHEHFTALQTLVFFQIRGGGGGHVIYLVYLQRGGEEGWLRREEMKGEEKERRGRGGEGETRGGKRRRRGEGKRGEDEKS